METTSTTENGKFVFTLSDDNDNTICFEEQIGGYITIMINGSEYVDVYTKDAMQEIVKAIGTLVGKVYFEDTDEVDILEIAI